MKKIQYLIAAIMIATACITTSCEDDLNDPTESAPIDGMLAFYNASQMFTNARILLNTDDVNYKADSAAGPGAVYMPVFVKVSGQWMAPGGGGSYYSTYPWVQYVRVLPGMQQVSFITADKQLAVKTVFDMEANQRSTVYLTDSLGSYQTTMVGDNCDPLDGTVQLNIVHLSPDAGKLALRIGGKWLREKDLEYRGHTGFIPFEVSTSSAILNVLVANAADTTNLVASNIISVEAEHCYTIMMKGYTKNYTNPVIKAGFEISIVKNK